MAFVNAVKTFNKLTYIFQLTVKIYKRDVKHQILFVMIQFLFPTNILLQLKNHISEIRPSLQPRISQVRHVLSLSNCVS